MRILFIVNDPPYGTERVYNALRLAPVLVKNDPDTQVTVFLMADACAVYAARPLVCRTQGLPLHYPGGVIPGAALLRGLRDVTCCPLNFQSQRPSPADILDAERVDQMLALVNLAHARDRGLDPLARQPLRALAL